MVCGVGDARVSIGLASKSAVGIVGIASGVGGDMAAKGHMARPKNSAPRVDD